ncbi:alpha/beta hydrolase [Clostridium rectalis]|uniref:alpha/beta hydrolase n=1 Tax=Clostridium rectalis TaxID=2040295 RepID=UPI000F63931F|nr:alpha/beta hydrolase [Clostridium rectalis]
MSMHLENKIKSFDGIEMFYTKDIPDKVKGIVVIVHGLCEHLGRYDYFTKKLNEVGYGVYRFDNRGHGKSEGERGYVDSFEDFFEDANRIVDMAKEENESLPIFMFGHSMGGFITTGYGIKYPTKLRGQILSGAAVMEMPIFDDIKKDSYFEKFPMEKVPNSLSKLLCRDEDIVKQYDEDPLVLEETTVKLLGEAFIKGASFINKNVSEYNYPSLIIHGEEDKIVIPEASKWLFSNIKSTDKTLKIYHRCYHEILNEKEERDDIINDIIRWIDNRI